MGLPSRSLRPPVELLAIGVGSWAAGVCAYAIVQASVFREFPQADSLIAALWSTFAWLPLLGVLYTPLLVVARAVVNPGPKVRAVLCAIAAIVPLTLVHSLWGRIHVPRLSPETVLFATLFTVAGAVFGVFAISDD